LVNPVAGPEVFVEASDAESEVGKTTVAKAKAYQLETSAGWVPMWISSQWFNGWGTQV
jgi:hypothetical protein